MRVVWAFRPASGAGRKTAWAAEVEDLSGASLSDFELLYPRSSGRAAPHAASTPLYFRGFQPGASQWTESQKYGGANGMRT